MRYWILIISVFLSNACFASDYAKSDEWLALGHYQNNKSSIDTPNFFLSSNGKFDPQSELKATIELFNGDDDKKKCLFPSRYLRLKQNGLIDKIFPNCEEYEQFKDDLQPSGLTLLFTDAYMNNPSSMFGHTLLRVDTKRKGTQLLAHGANYGAFTGDDSGALYAILGLTGGYFGGFTVKPYYDIINTYNNIENRDIWELNLDLSQDELDFFVAHLWEVGQTQSRYYFFTRNCSYMLMEMLDAVRPSLKLAKKFPVQAIPLDTFKAVYNSPHMVKGINYRPSRQNKIRHRFNMMNDEQKLVYENAIKNKDFNLSENMGDEEKANVLETLYQFVQYQYVAKKLDLKEYRRASFDLLRSRSQLSMVEKFEDPSDAKSPLNAHESMRLVMGGGIRNDEFFEEISYRPAYQSLTDNNWGLPKGAEINFLESKFRHYEDRDKYVLQSMDLISIRSISPADVMFDPLSFQVRANIERWQNPDNEKEGYIGNIIIGTGKTYAFTDWLWGFALANTKIAYRGFLPHNSWLGFGFDIGVLVDYKNWKLIAEVEPQWASQELGQMVNYKTELNYVIDTNWSIGGNVLYEDKYGSDTKELSLGLRYYF